MFFSSLCSFRLSSSQANVELQGRVLKISAAKAQTPRPRSNETKADE